jgi:hypothetical protein
MPKAACDQSHERLIQECITRFGEFKECAPAWLFYITMRDTWKFSAPMRQANSNDRATGMETTNLHASFAHYFERR